jgi:CMP-N,N'-diacetyllegionaminic acid synthase
MLYSDKKIVVIIPARGGSKGIKNKNIIPLADKPLIAYPIELALKVDCIDRVIVSTDSSEIAEISKKYGAEVPFLRPSEFSSDTSGDREVFVHLIEWLIDNEGYEFDYLMNLRCTTPLKKAEHIEAAVEMVLKEDCDSVRTVDLIQGKHHPYWMFKKDDNGFGTSFIDGLKRSQYYQRQMLPPAYSVNALVDIIKVDTIMNADADSLYGRMKLLETDPIYSIDIDTTKDLIICEALIQNLT